MATTENDRALRLLIERTPAVLWTTDASLRLRTVSGAPLRSLHAEHLVGRSVADVVDEGPSASSAVLAHHRALEGEAVTFDARVARRRFRCHVEPLRDENGAIAGVIGVGLDVTKRVEAEARLSGAEATYKALVEQIPAAVYIDAVDERSTALYSSPQIESMLGYTPAEWTSDPDLWVKLLHDDDRARVLTASMHSNRSGEPFAEEYRLVARDGRVVWVRDEAVMVRDPDGRPRCWQGVMFDVTDRKRTEENLERSVRMLRAADEDRRRLLGHLVQAQEDERAAIASEIHDDSLQVMVALGMRLEMLEGRIADPPGLEELRQARETLDLCVERMRNLLFEVRPPVLDREGLVAALRVRVGSMRLETDLRCSLEDHLTREPPQEVRTILYRIAVEALNNVRKHSRATRVMISCDVKAGEAHITVRDNGIGVDPCSLGGGMGVRQSIFKRMSTRGGHASLDSAPGKGVLVTLRMANGERVA